MDKITWNEDAEKELARVPFPLRPLVRRKVSERVAKRGGDCVTVADFREAEEKFKSAASGKSEKNLTDMMPAKNVPGASMIVVDTCHSELSGCPNTLFTTSAVSDSLNEWISRSDLSERLRKGIKDDKILYHHKLKFSIAGCPNGCSRPQIADIALVGYVRPEFEKENCISCGACEAACPDRAIAIENGFPEFDLNLCLGCLSCKNACNANCIKTSTPSIRLFMGGKLGRHPHLADKIIEVATPAQAIDLIDGCVNDFIENALPGERFADFYIRVLKDRCVFSR